MAPLSNTTTLEWSWGTRSPHSTLGPETEVALGSVVATIIACILSIIGALTIVLTYIFYKDIRSPSRKLLVFLSIADLLTATGFLYGTVTNYQESCVACQIQSGIICFGQLSSFFWTFFVTIYLYLTIVKADVARAERLYPFFHVLGWGLPLTVVVIAGFLGGLGYDSSNISVRWCWINLMNPNYLFWMLFTLKFWEFAAYFIIPLLCILMKVHIYRHRKRSLSSARVRSGTIEALVRIDRKLLFIPTVFIFLRIWGSLRFVFYIAGSPALSNQVLVTLHGIGNSFQGGANCILYCFLTKSIREKLKEGFVHICTCQPCVKEQLDPTEKPLCGYSKACDTCCCNCWPCCRRKVFVHVKSLDYYEKLGVGEATSLINSR